MAKVSGLIAIPRLDKKGSIPFISYQHGTVFGRYDAPSYAFKASNPAGYAHYDDAYETRYMVGLYAGNGYALMAADYFGLGDASDTDEGYMIKRGTAKANYDLYLAARPFLAEKNIEVSKFYLGG